MPRKYKTIVIDPPWAGPGETPAFDSENKATGKKMKLSLIPYSTMTGIQVASLRVSEQAADDAQLWIWCCSRSVGDAVLLAQLWSFKYRALFVWDKQRIGLGRHARGQCEFLLWAARRGARLVDPKQCPRQIQQWPKPNRHSEKPAEAYQFIRSLSDAPRLDIFARQHRPGFTAWGNQVPEDLEAKAA